MARWHTHKCEVCGKPVRCEAPEEYDSGGACSADCDDPDGQWFCEDCGTERDYWAQQGLCTSCGATICKACHGCRAGGGCAADQCDCDLSLEADYSMAGVR